MMSTLRDENLRNLTISESILTEINEKLTNIITEENLKNQEDAKALWISYIIRFDKKGKSLLSFDEAMSFYRNANNIERIIFSVECAQSFQNKMFGKSINIQFDKTDINNCRIVVQGDESNWVDSAYNNLMEVINKHKNYNFIFKNSATPFLVQIMGVFIGVLLSIKGAQWLSPKLNLEYALPFGFVIIFLLFSNVWTFLYAVFLKGIDKLWPNITFKEKQNVWMIILKWMMNVILGFVFLVGVKSVFSFLFDAFISIFNK